MGGKSAAVKLENKLQKPKRNKLWRKKKRQHIGGMLPKDREKFKQADKDDDESRAREIAKEMTKRRVDKMKEITKQKAQEERKRLELELELVLIREITRITLHQDLEINKGSKLLTRIASDSTSHNRCNWGFLAVYN